MDAFPPDKPENSESLTVERAIANLQGDDLGLRFYAAWWLGRFRVCDEAAIRALITALEDESDRTEAGGYPLRRNAARALGKLGDRRAVAPLIQCLSCPDFYVREAAAQALEMLGDPASIPPLLQLLRDEMSGTLPAPEQPDINQPYDAIVEALGTLQATAAIPLIKPFLEYPVERIKYAAARALYQLTPEPQTASQYGDILIQALSGDELQLRRTALADLGAIGYLAAAEPIASTLAENSLKLIALKGLLEYQVQQMTPPDLSEGAIRVMALMDDLL
jgi:phycocyanobilin lyase alpha subunit